MYVNILYYYIYYLQQTFSLFTTVCYSFINVQLAQRCFGMKGVDQDVG